MNSKLNYSSIIGLFVGLFFSIKLLRYIVPEGNILGQIHILMLIFFFIIIMININRLTIYRMDFIILLFSFFIFFSWFINNIINLTFDNFSYLARYFFVIFGYFLFKFIYINFYTLLNLLFYISVVFIIIYFFEAFSSFYSLNFIDYNSVPSLNISSRTFLSTTWNNNIGITLSSHGTSVLYASFSICFYYLKKNNQYSLFRSNLVFYLSLLIVLHSMVGIGLFVFILLFFSLSLLKKQILVIILIVPLFVLSISYFQYGNDYLNALLYISKVNINDGISFKNLLTVFFGEGRFDSSYIFSEITYFVTLSRIGIVNLILFFTIIYYSYKYTYFMKKYLFIDLYPFFIIICGLFIGGLHYESFFNYPSSLIAFILIGYISQTYRYNILEKEKNYES